MGDVTCTRSLDGLIEFLAQLASSRTSPLLVARSIAPFRLIPRPVNRSHISNFFVASPAYHPFLDLMMNTWNKSYTFLQNASAVVQELNFAGPVKWQNLHLLWNKQPQAKACEVLPLWDQAFVRYNLHAGDKTY